MLALDPPIPTLARAAPATSAEFGVVYHAHRASIWRYVALMTRNGADADDLTSDVFERAYRASQRGDGPSGDWLPWLLVIARRLVITRWRRQRLLRLVPLVGDFSRRDRTSSFDDAEAAIWLEQVARTLPARQREALFLRYLRDLGDDDVAYVLGLSSSGVRSLISRAIANLRQHPELWT